MDTFEFFITTMPQTRPADYYLGCLNGSVFLDFKDYDDSIYLIRISFDSYGCCDLGDSSIPLNKEDSYTFKKILQSQILDQNKIEMIIKRIISLNKPLIWINALEEYQLA